MAMFDPILSEVGGRFGIGDKSKDLLAALIALINERGLSGFLEMFGRVGLGEVSDSWVSRGANTPLSIQQIEDGLGADLIGNLATQANLPPAQAKSALAFMIPSVVDSLTPDGVLRELPVAAVGGGYPIGAERTETAVAAADASGGTALRWVLPILLIGLLGYLSYLFLVRPNQPVQLTTAANRGAVAKTNSNVNANVAAPTKKVDSRLTLKAEGGKYFVSGTVASEAEQREIIEKLKAQFGEASLDFSGLKVDPNVKTVSWLTKFYELLPSLKGWTSGSLTFEGENRLSAVGNVPQAAIDKIKLLFAGWNLPPIFLGTGAEAQKAATEQTAKALETAQNPQEVVDALNLDIINFPTGKSDVPPQNQENLKKAAEVLKNAPAGTRLEIGGHTDNVGDKIKNQKLSEERAASVKKQLETLGVKPETLTARGYGDTKPKADNKTKEGQFQNRRIEYTLQN